jgi:hypothetical protein
MRTRGEMLSDAISFALNKAVKVVRGLRKGLTNEERYEVANRAVDEMKKHGDPWRLSEEIEYEGPTLPPSPMQGKWTP